MITISPQEERILALAEPLLGELGLDIVRVRIMGSKRPLLQIMIEKVGGAQTDVEDCASFSRMFSPILEAADPISDPYRLEVSTPGIDRPLTREGDFGNWVGHLARVELAMPFEGRRRFRGIILREDEDGVAIELDDATELVAKVSEMTKASLVLTDELIDQALASGSASQPDNVDLDSVETVDAEHDTIEDNEESGA